MTDRQTLQDSPITPEQAAEFIRGRRTVDKFVADRVPETQRLHEAIEVARWAPNHHVTEPWRFYLLGPATQRAIIELNSDLLRATRGADVAEAKRERWAKMPGWLAVTCVCDKDPVTANEDYAACACAIQNLSLYLHSAGISTKWASGAVTREARFLEIIGADASYEYCVGLVWYGFAARRPRSQRQPVEGFIRACD